MKITFLLPVVSMSGGIRVVVIHAKNLAKKGHVVTLISPAPTKPKFRDRARQFLKTGKSLRWEKSPQSHIDGTGLRHIVAPHSGPLKIEDIPPSDVIVATWWETAEWLMNWPASCGAKVYFIQGHETFDFLPIERVKNTYHSDLYKITVSDWLCELMKFEYKVPQCDLVSNAVDHFQFNSSVRSKNIKPSIGFLYGSTRLKGMDVSLAVVDKLFGCYPHLEVISFGSKFDPEFSMDSRINFIESPPQDEIKNIYAACDVWLSTSRSEGFGLTAMEAMACRTPVVSTRTGWPFKAIIDGENGYLNDIDDIEGLYASVVKILDLNNEEWMHMSEEAFGTVKNVSWEISSDLFEKSLISAINITR